MARKKELYVKDALDHLEQARRVLTDVRDGGVEAGEVQMVRAAARQAEQAAATLRELAGVLDAEDGINERFRTALRAKPQSEVVKQ